eukprot:157646-Chlamydomonas_euryale.AAC.5
MKRSQFLNAAVATALQKKTCPMGDNCMWSHNVFEHWLHPTRYKTRLCLFGRNCNRSICFFAHSTDELRPSVSGSEDSKELDEREYLMQLMLAQEAGMLPRGTVDQFTQPGALGAGSPASVCGGGMQRHKQALGSLASTKDHARQLQQPMSALSGNRNEADGMFMELSGFGTQGRQQRQQHAGQVPPHHRSSHASHARGPGAPLQLSSCASEPLPPLEASMLAGGPGQHLDTASLLLGLQESLASLHCGGMQLGGANGSSASAAAGGDGCEQLVWPPSATSPASLADAGAPPNGRTSDPGMLDQQNVMAATAAMNPVRHLNRISDSGQVLGLAKGMADLESLLSSLHSSMRQQQQQQKQQVLKHSTSGLLGSPCKLHSAGSGSDALSESQRNSHESVSSLTSAVTASTPDADAAAAAAAGDASKAHERFAHCGGAGEPSSDGGTSGAASAPVGASTASLPLDACAAAAVLAQMPVTGLEVGAQGAYVKELMECLQQQGVLHPKEHLIQSLSQLLSQLLV